MLTNVIEFVVIGTVVDVKLIFPVVPHLSSECLDTLGENKKIEWPKIEEKFLRNESYNIVIQINGKKKDLIVTNKSVTEEDVLNLIKSNAKLKKLLNNTNIKKTIYIENKLINLII